MSMDGATGDDAGATRHLGSMQRALRELARAVVGHDVAGQLPTAQELQAALDVGAGTVQRAFAVLEELGAVHTRAHGHRGRFVVRRDLGRLWSLAGLPPVTCVMTPPGAAEIYALTSALTGHFAATGVPLTVDYVRGGQARLARARRDAATFAVLSAGAARASADDLARLRLPEGSYYARDSIVVLERAGSTGSATPVVGVDRSSDDHLRLTVAEYGEAALTRAVDVPFPEVPAAILRREIDTGVWHRMVLLIPPELAGLVARPLSAAATDALSGETGAVLVYRAADTALGEVLRTLDPSATATGGGGPDAAVSPWIR